MELLNCGSGAATADEGQTFYTLLAAIYTSAASAGVQVLIFVLLRMRLSRIYRPKSYLVAERERIAMPPNGLWQWVKPLFTTSDASVIQKCGLDAYFFLRYLRMLLKIFVPLACLIIPILLPINEMSGNGTVKGVSVLGWQNVSAAHVHRLWAHLVLAIVAIVWVLFVVYKELRGYIRIRQAYLTSPQHRIRASATTVLVSGIPKKWLTVEALNGLYDVFPGGIRNIWINRNFDELADKVKERRNVALSLESAETDLIRTCVKKYKADQEKKAKLEGRAKKTKLQKEAEAQEANEQAENIAQGAGTSSGDPHHIPHNIHEALEEINHHENEKDPASRFLKDPFLKIGEGFGAGFGAVGHGIGNLGHLGKNLMGGVTGNVNRAIREVDQSLNAANAPAFADGFAMGDDGLFPTRPTKSRPTSYSPVVPAARDATPDQHAQQEKETPQSDRPTGLRSPKDIAVMDRLPPPQMSPFPPSRNASSPVNTQSDGHSLGTDQKSPNAYTKTNDDEKAGRSSARNSVSQKAWNFVTKRDPPIPFPSPQPHTSEEDEFPLTETGQPKHLAFEGSPDQELSKSKWANKFGWLAFWRKKPEAEEEVKEVYPEAFNEDCAEDQDGEPVWKQYLEAKDRDTMREPLFNKSWFPRLPLVGKKIDKIYHLRKELARLNVEIEQDQKNIEKFPFMNSAFIQFNHQVAAHMACQSLSHHVPHHMTPRLIEISPSDVLWENMSTKWWEKYLRTFLVTALALALIIFYTIPVAFTGFLSQVDRLSTLFTWLHWLRGLPKMAKAIIQGVLPPVLLSAILSLVPIIFRLMIKNRGVPTGSDKERGVQTFYFVFLFIQVFLVISVSSGITTFVQDLVSNAFSITTELANSLPSSSNYFFSYLIVQALSNSASSLLQVSSLLKWFLWAPLRDSTARKKWRRQTNLNNVKWGSFFPPYTNFAVIGIIFSIISPLIMVFNIIVFSLYWFAQRYNILYVYQFRIDTGGLLFPTAVNQLFVGVYVMELCLIGLFFIAKDTDGKLAAIPQASIMIAAIICTAGYQWLLNDAFRPLFRYLPITLEDDAVIRDEEFARAQNQKFQRLIADDGDQGDGHDLDSALEERERKSEEESRLDLEAEHQRIRAYRMSGHNNRTVSSNSGHGSLMETKPTSTRSGADRWNAIKKFSAPVGHMRSMARQRTHSASSVSEEHGTRGMRHTATDVNPQKVGVDVESQQAVGDVLYSGFSDELEDLTPEERDTLIRYSFQHSALRARRPVIWIPRDPLGISDDEIERCKQMSTVEVMDPETEKRETKTNLWISNEGTALDAKCRVVFRRSPPDFANVDLIAL